MHQLKVKLWGKEIGHLVWNSETRTANFVYNQDKCDSPDTVPDIAPLLSPKDKRSSGVPVYGDERPLYQGLPPLIADSLPVSWGSTLMDIWFKDNKLSNDKPTRNKITSLHKLAFIGARGMGALEFEPISNENDDDFASLTLPLAAAPNSHIHSFSNCPLNIKFLHELSIKISQGQGNLGTVDN